MDVKINMLGENIQSFIDLNGVKKINLQMLIGAILAGAYIGFGSVMMVIANQVLANPIMNGFVFSLGLILVVFACGELATGSMMSYAFKNVNVK
jgi:formate/nitrite transporter FocA (FNT family)